MFFLIRMAFWLSVVLVLLPSGGSKQNAAMPSADIGAGQAVSAASATVADMSKFCSREPQACAVGSQAAVAFGERAQAGAKMVYDFINERAAPRDTGSIASKATRAATAAKSSQDTLTAADLAPAWRGPRRDVHSKHGA
jgi:hypothetical protein